MKSHSIAIAALSTLVLAACHHDDADQSPASTQYAHVICWNGVMQYFSTRIYDGDTAAGQPLSIDSSGVDFYEAKTNKHMHVYGGTCLVEYHDQ